MYTYGYIIQLHYTAETNNTVKQSYSYLKIFGGKIYVNRKFVIKKKKEKDPHFRKLPGEVHL